MSSLPRSQRFCLISAFYMLQLCHSLALSFTMISLRRSLPMFCAQTFQRRCCRPRSRSRLFASQARDGNIPGEIYIEDDQTALKVDLSKLEDTVGRIRKILGYETYSVSLLLVDDDAMKDTNRETRGINAPTDILSFPMLQAIEPGVLEEPEFDIPDYYNLGDMLVDVPYVIRRCQEDKHDALAALNDTQEAGNELEGERGVSGAMATVYDPELRLHMLLVHGMLHLVGHDHEEDDEYDLMVLEEERILDMLQSKDKK